MNDDVEEKEQINFTIILTDYYSQPEHLLKVIEFADHINISTPIDDEYNFIKYVTPINDVGNIIRSLNDLSETSNVDYIKNHLRTLKHRKPRHCFIVVDENSSLSYLINHMDIFKDINENIKLNIIRYRLPLKQLVYQYNDINSMKIFCKSLVLDNTFINELDKNKVLFNHIHIGERNPFMSILIEIDSREPDDILNIGNNKWKRKITDKDNVFNDANDWHSEIDYSESYSLVLARLITKIGKTNE